MKHRWNEKHVVSPHKTERECANGCVTIKVTRHEANGPRDVHWIEFWRDCERIEGKETPACEPIVPSHLAAQLATFCAENGERVPAVVADAIMLHLDQLEAESGSALSEDCADR